MSSTLTLTPIARRHVTGLCNGPQGADGVDVLAREAYLSMLSAEWAEDTRAPIMPVHEFDRDPPAGQAYKAVWGYDASARTERSSCGAECYTYKVPVDAFAREADADAGTDAVEAAAIESVSLRLAGDRYLDRGALVWIELSSSPLPSPLAMAVAATDGVARLATQTQVDGAGTPIAPNNRHGMEESVSIGMDSAAPAAYIHVHLFLADYLGVRGAWIEGGAMFASDELSVSFSREVEVSEADTESGACALDIGRVTFEMGDDATMTPAYALARIPRLSLWQNFRLAAHADVFAALTGDSYALRIANLLAYLESSPALWATAGMPASAAALSYGQTGLLAVSRSTASGSSFDGSDSIGFCCICAHGLTRRRVFRGIRFANAIPADIPYRLLVYGVSADLAIASSAQGSTLRFATPLAYWADVLSRAFREGRSESLRVLTDSSLSASSMPAAGDGDTTDVAVQPLAARSVSEPLARVTFDRPFPSGELSSLVVALIPEGGPASDETSATTIQGTATRDIVAAIPVSALCERLTAAVTLSNCQIRFAVTTKLSADISKLTSFPELHRQHNPGEDIAYSDGYTYHWGEHLSQRGTVVWHKANFATAALTTLKFSFSRSGKTYSFDTTAGDACPSLQFKATFRLRFPVSACDTYGPLDYQYFGNPSGSVAVTAHAPDGSTLPVVLSFNGSYVVTMRVPNPDAYTQAGWNQLEEYGELVRNDGPPFYYGYISPRDWYNRGSGICNSYAYNDSSEADSTIVATSRATLAGYAYSFASAANENAVSTVTQSGIITFVRDGVTYSAPYSYTRTPTLSVTSKTSSRIIVGNDTTQTATILGAVNGLNTRLLFTGSDGSTLWAQAHLQQGSCEGDIPYQARSASNKTAQGIGTVNNDGTGAYGGDGLVATITIRESYANVTVDPGLITLYE